VSPRLKRTSRLRIAVILAVLAAAVLPLTGGAAPAGRALYPDVAAPAAIMTADGTIEVFIRGQNNELVQRSYAGNGWSGWKNLGGHITAAPSVTSSRPGRLDVLVRGMNNELVYRYFQYGRWSGWINLGGEISSAPAAVSTGPGLIEVFARGGGSTHMSHRSYRNGFWDKWTSDFSTSVASAPAAVSPSPGRIELFVRDDKNQLKQRSYDGSDWSSWKNLGGEITAGPAAVATGPNQMIVFVRGRSGELVHRIGNGTSWGGWRNDGGFFTSAPAAATDGGRVEVFVRGQNDDLVQRTYVGGLWSSWKTLGGQIRGHLHRRLRILTHNVYGLDGNWCAARAREFGWRVAHAQPAYDIVGVQEYYNAPDFDIGTCDADPLSDSIMSTGRYRNSDNHYRHYPEVNNGFDGGVGIFTLFPIVKFDDWEWRNDAQPPKAAEGFIFARIRISDDLSIDTYVVHLNSNVGDPAAIANARRRLQLQQLRDKIAELSRGNGNPVIVMGDFNIGGPPSRNGNSGYDAIRSTFTTPDDIWLEAWPRSNGWTNDCASNQLASGCSDEGERIDYILVPTSPRLTSSRFVVTVAKPADVGVARWRTELSRLSEFERRYVKSPIPVSDHWGVEASLEIRER
jgi:endonuclease/exonuclease/phosphatase family metal-dependent hydrolase